MTVYHVKPMSAVPRRACLKFARTISWTHVSENFSMEIQVGPLVMVQGHKAHAVKVVCVCCAFLICVLLYIAHIHMSFN